MYRDGDLFFVVLFQIPMPFGNLAKRALGDACIKSFVMTKKIIKEETVIGLITAWVVKCALIQCAKKRSIYRSHFSFAQPRQINHCSCWSPPRLQVVTSTISNWEMHSFHIIRCQKATALQAAMMYQAADLVSATMHQAADQWHRWRRKNAKLTVRVSIITKKKRYCALVLVKCACGCFFQNHRSVCVRVIAFEAKRRVRWAIVATGVWWFCTSFAAVFVSRCGEVNGWCSQVMRMWLFAAVAWPQQCCASVWFIKIVKWLTFKVWRSGDVK